MTVPRATVPRTPTGAVDWDRVDWDNYDWRDFVEEEAGPAELAARGVLNWRAVCSHIGEFAATSLGKRATKQLDVPRTLARTLELQNEAKAVQALHLHLHVSLDFGGISTDTADRALRRANKGGVVDGPHLLSLAGLVSGGRRLQAQLAGAQAAANSTAQAGLVQVLSSRFQALTIDRTLCNRINADIDEEGAVREGASPELKAARAKVGKQEARLRGVLARAGGGTGEVVTHGGRLCIAVPAGGPRPSGMVLGSSPGGAVTYVEPPAAVAGNNALVADRAEAVAAEEAVLWARTADVVAAAGDLGALLEAVAWLDAACARSGYTEWIDGYYPEFVEWPWRRGEGNGTGTGGGGGEEPWVCVRRMRHPLLLGWYLRDVARAKRAQVMAQGRPSESTTASSPPPTPVVPVDFLAPPAARAVIVTGPNTGGKTAAMKALGLCVLLANAGVGVPAAPPVRLPRFSRVLADIGDEQSLAANLSTFSSHLARIQGLRAEADDEALVLLDEVGTGTDPTEGTALGLALLQRLVRGGPGGAGLVVASTHMSALTGLKYEDEARRFENASAEFDECTLAPTYRLLWGVPGRSNAVTIAARLGLPEDITLAATQILGSEQAELDRLVSRVEAEQRELDRATESAEALRARLTEVAAETALAEREIEEADIRARTARAEVLATPVRELLSRLTQLQNLEAELERGQKRTSSLEHKRRQDDEAMQAAVRAQVEEGWAPAVGDMVRVRKLNSSGEITAVKGKRVKVTVGGLSMTVKLSEVVAM